MQSRVSQREELETYRGAYGAESVASSAVPEESAVGVTWSYGRKFFTNLAAACRTRCNGARVACGRSASIALQ